MESFLYKAGKSLPVNNRMNNNEILDRPCIQWDEAYSKIHFQKTWLLFPIIFGPYSWAITPLFWKGFCPPVNSVASGEIVFLNALFSLPSHWICRNVEYFNVWGLFVLSVCATCVDLYEIADTPESISKTKILSLPVIRLVILNS